MRAMMKTVVIESNHNDYSGGGRYSLQLAYALSNFCSVYTKRFRCDDPEFSGINYRIKPFRNDFTPDLFIGVSHLGGIRPIGKFNAHVCFFPLESARKSVVEYDLAISICDFSDRYQKTVWGLPSVVINPSIDMKSHYIDTKENIIMNVGNYFMVEDGQSKNQHLVLEWYLDNGLYKEYELVFTGFVVTKSYYKKLVKVAKEHPTVKIFSKIAFRDLAAYYAKSRFLIHANGFRRSSPHHTEHFGIVAIEALASGCQPIVHNSGGCSEIQGVRIWNSFDEIKGLMGDADSAELRGLAERYSDKYILHNQVMPFLRQVFHEDVHPL
jgi:glycosyltransferase involved in cell wall biosynthesis